MGIRLHVATKYQVEHNGEITPFNNKSEEINTLLHAHCPNLSWEGEDFRFSERLQVPREDLANLIGYVVANPEEYTRWASQNGISENASEFICILAFWIANSDQRNDFVVLSWY